VLSSIEGSLEMKRDALLEELLGTSDFQAIAGFVQAQEEELRARALWALARYARTSVSFEQIKKELQKAKNDGSRILLAAALYQLNSSPTSQEMRFLAEYYTTHYYDEVRDELIVDITCDFGLSAAVLGFILWEVGYKFFAMDDDLAAYDLDWLTEKNDEKEGNFSILAKK